MKYKLIKYLTFYQLILIFTYEMSALKNSSSDKMECSIRLTATVSCYLTTVIIHTHFNKQQVKMHTTLQKGNKHQ